MNHPEAPCIVILFLIFIAATAVSVFVALRSASFGSCSACFAGGVVVTLALVGAVPYRTVSVVDPNTGGEYVVHAMPVSALVLGDEILADRESGREVFQPVAVVPDQPRAATPKNKPGAAR